MLQQPSHQQSAHIFKHTQNYLTKINSLDPKTPNPQQLLLFLLNHNFSPEQCFDITQSTDKKHKLQQQITYLRTKISDIIHSNQKIISLLQKRDQKTILIQKLLNQRNQIQLNVQLQSFRNKYKPKDHLLQPIKPLIPDQKTTIKQNLRYQKLTNRQFNDKIKQLKNQCQKVQKHNQILSQQQQIHLVVDSLNSQSIRNRTNHTITQNNSLMNYLPRTMNSAQSEIWIDKIQQIKQRHLMPQKQCEKLYIYKQAKKLQQSPYKSPKRYNSPTKNDSIYSDKFWYNNLRDHRTKDKENTGYVSPSNSQIKDYIYRSKSRENNHSTKNNVSEHSLSRVKSLGSINTTCRTNIYSYRKIYQ